MRHRMTSEDYSGLQIGHKIVWVSSDGPEVGEVKWIGVLPDARRQDDITVGVQFVSIWGGDIVAGGGVTMVVIRVISYSALLGLLKERIYS